MATLKHIDFEVPNWGELAAGPTALSGLLSRMLDDAPTGLWVSPASGSTWPDLSSFGRHATASNATYGSTGPFARWPVTPGRLNGTNAYLDLPAASISSLNAFTFECWLYWRGPSNSPWQRAWDANAGGSSRYCIITPYNNVYGGGALFAISATGGGAGTLYLSSSTPLALNQWSHLAVTCNHTIGQYTLYRNGSSIASATSSLRLSQLGLTVNRIGRSAYASDPYLYADVALAAVYPAALSAATLASRYPIGVTGP